MISKLFLDKVIELYMCDISEHDINLDLITNDLKQIFSVENDNYKDIPVKLINQFDFCKTLVNTDWTKMSKDVFIDSISDEHKFIEFKSLLSFQCTQKLTQSQLNEILNIISLKKESLFIENDKLLLEEFVDKFDSNGFLNSENMVNEFENMISSIYTRTILKNKSSNNNLTKNFIFNSDEDIQKAITMVEDYRSVKNKLKTGIKSFDEILRGGFENNRIYIVGGTPGVGKSLFLLHFLLKTLFNKDNDQGLYIYFTLENMINETLDRLYTMIPNYYDDHSSFKNPAESLKEKLSEARSLNKLFTIQYLPPYTSTVNDIMISVDQLIMKTGLKPKVIFVDYLDLLTSVNKTELYRLELGYVTMELKTLSIKYDTPVITPTQLNSSGYGDTPDLVSITESKKKVEHADFVSILANRSKASNGNLTSGIIEDNKVIMFVRKNRNGPLKNIAFNVNYNKMKIDPSNNTSITQISSNDNYKFRQNYDNVFGNMF